MSKYTVKPFRRLWPSIEHSDSILDSDPPPAIRPLYFQAADAAVSAGHFFRGVYPFESPMYLWGKFYWLPWAKKYTLPADAPQDAEPVDITDEVCSIATDLLAMRKLLGFKGFGLTEGAALEFASYHVKRKSSDPTSSVQHLAVETMLAVDEGLFALDANDIPHAALAIITAHQTLIECCCVAQGVLGFASDKARDAANVMHQENRACKKQVFDWLDANMSRCPTLDAAADEIAEKVVPMKWRTVRGWITEWNRERGLRAARRR